MVKVVKFLAGLVLLRSSMRQNLKYILCCVLLSIGILVIGRLGMLVSEPVIWGYTVVWNNPRVKLLSIFVQHYFQSFSHWKTIFIGLYGMCWYMVCSCFALSLRFDLHLYFYHFILWYRLVVSEFWKGVVGGCGACGDLNII